MTFLLSQEITAQGAKGPYKQLEVTYKDANGKPAAKKLFTSSPVYAIFKSAAGGTTWDVAQVKNEKGYFDWTGATPLASLVTATSPLPTINPNFQADHNPAVTTSKTFAGKTTSTYATPEERANTQIYIVRQSSLKLAVDEGKKGRDVFIRASEFEDFVFNGTIPQEEETLKKTTTGKKSLPVASESFDGLETLDDDGFPE